MLIWPRLSQFAVACALLCASIGLRAADVKRPADLIIKLRPGSATSDQERALRNSASSRPVGTSLRRHSVAAAAASAPQPLALSLKPGVPVASELARLAGNPAVDT